MGDFQKRLRTDLRNQEKWKNKIPMLEKIPKAHRKINSREATHLKIKDWHNPYTLEELYLDEEIDAQKRGNIPFYKLTETPHEKNTDEATSSEPFEVTVDEVEPEFFPRLSEDSDSTPEYFYHNLKFSRVRVDEADPELFRPVQEKSASKPEYFYHNLKFSKHYEPDADPSSF